MRTADRLERCAIEQGMQPISNRLHHFPPEVIRHAVWHDLRFTLSDRNGDDSLSERELEISYETIRRWVIKLGPAFARN
jgi:putative transposase